MIHLPKSGLPNKVYQQPKYYTQIFIINESIVIFSVNSINRTDDVWHERQRKSSKPRIWETGAMQHMISKHGCRDLLPRSFRSISEVGHWWCPIKPARCCRSFSFSQRRWMGRHLWSLKGNQIFPHQTGEISLCTKGPCHNETGNLQTARRLKALSYCIVYCSILSIVCCDINISPEGPSPKQENNSPEQSVQILLAMQRGKKQHIQSNEEKSKDSRHIIYQLSIVSLSICLIQHATALSHGKAE